MVVLRRKIIIFGMSWVLYNSNRSHEEFVGCRGRAPAKLEVTSGGNDWVRTSDLALMKYKRKCELDLCLVTLQCKLS